MLLTKQDLISRAKKIECIANLTYLTYLTYLFRRGKPLDYIEIAKPPFPKPLNKDAEA